MNISPRKRRKQSTSRISIAFYVVIAIFIIVVKSCREIDERITLRDLRRQCEEGLVARGIHTQEDVIVVDRRGSDAIRNYLLTVRLHGEGVALLESGGTVTSRLMDDAKGPCHRFIDECLALGGDQVMRSSFELSSYSILVYVRRGTSTLLFARSGSGAGRLASLVFGFVDSIGVYEDADAMKISDE